MILGMHLVVPVSQLLAIIAAASPNDSMWRIVACCFEDGACVEVPVHECLLEGGMYFYPADSAHMEGKLRLLYECAPLAFVVEQAGGRASTGARRILDIEAESIHQRVPLVIGSAEDVLLFERFLGGGNPA